MGPRPRIASTCGPASGRPLAPRRAASGPRNPLAAGSVPPRFPSRSPISLGSGQPGHLLSPDNSVVAHTPVGQVFRGLTGAGICSRSHVSYGTRRSATAAGKLGATRAGAQRAVGQLGTEFCPCPASPPGAPSRPAAESSGPPPPREPAPERPPAANPMKTPSRYLLAIKGIDYFPRGRDAFFIASLTCL